MQLVAAGHQIVFGVSCPEAYPYALNDTIDVQPMIRCITEDIIKGKESGEISGRFHFTISDLITRTVSRIREESGIEKVALSGGTFQNRIILEHFKDQLEERGFSVFINKFVPPNDGGISLGQGVAALSKII